MTVHHYPAIIEGDPVSGYSVFFPDLPGCTSASATLQEAAINAEQALAGHVAVMLEHGDAVPAPSRLDDLPRPIEPDVVEASRLLVRIDLRERALILARHVRDREPGRYEEADTWSAAYDKVDVAGRLPATCA